MEKRIIIFDFDGVIADTMALHFDINQSLYPALTPTQYRRWFYVNVYHAISQGKVMGSYDSEEAITAFFAEQKKHLDDIDVFPPIAQQITSFYRNGYVLYIVSSNQETAITAILDRYAMTQYFAEIYGMEAGRSKVQKLDLIKRAHPTAARMFITDTLGDLHEAATVHIPTLAVLWGLHNRHELGNGRTLDYIAKPQHLFSVVSETFQRYL